VSLDATLHSLVCLNRPSLQTSRPRRHDLALVLCAAFAYIRRFRMDETRLKRLRFRAWRRGFREADLILGPFADSHAQSLTEDQTLVFEQLLDLPDHDVYGWIVSETAPPSFATDVIGLIRAFHAAGPQPRGPHT
jgi:antitoxin CptB